MAIHSFNRITPIDCLNRDYLSQESTEAPTLDMIRSSDELVRILDGYGLTPDDVCDYHVFPVADNETPKLSAYLSWNLEYWIEGTFGQQ